MNLISNFTKGCVVALVFSFVSLPALAHDGKHPDAPNPSPNGSVSQEVGYGKVDVAFGRPGMKGRTIWGDLVPFNGGDPRPWVAGANGSTVVTFAEDVKVNGQALKAGAYGFFIIPEKDQWTLIFSSDSSKFGIMKYSADKDVLRLTVKPEKSDHQEWLDYRIEKTGELTATLSLHWENLKAGFTIEAPDHREH
ncbi:MAG: DUF2911 domain-containing protein [Candidatus Hydrogenedentota bacterium]